jgi:hypothetical protein
MLGLLSAVAQFECELLLEGQREGPARATMPLLVALSRR